MKNILFIFLLSSDCFNPIELLRNSITYGMRRGALLLSSYFSIVLEMAFYIHCSEWS